MKPARLPPKPSIRRKFDGAPKFNCSADRTPQRSSVSFASQDAVATFTPHLRHCHNTNPRFAESMARQEAEHLAAPAKTRHRNSRQRSGRCRLTHQHPYRQHRNPPPMARAAGPVRRSQSSSRTLRASNSDDPIVQRPHLLTIPPPFLPSGGGIQARRYAEVMFYSILPRPSGPLFAQA